LNAPPNRSCESVRDVRQALRKAKTNTVNSINEMDGPAGHYLVVFSLDRPPLLAVGLPVQPFQWITRTSFDNTVSFCAEGVRGVSPWARAARALAISLVTLPFKFARTMTAMLSSG